MTTPAHDIAAPAFRLDPAHPNYARWQSAIDGAVERGGLVRALLGDAMPLAGARVLDIGCGVGGTSIALHRAGARVTALDRDARRLSSLREREPGIETLQGEASDLPYQDSSFGAVILQDVIEHTGNPEVVLAAAARVLKPGGFLYLSTPNKRAVTNFVSDPHWGLPVLAILRRPALRKALRLLRPGDAERSDLAELLSKKRLFALLTGNGFSISMQNRLVARMLFERPDAVVWSEGHRRAVRLLAALRLHRFVIALARGTPGWGDFLLTPAWYLLCRKEQP